MNTQIHRMTISDGDIKKLSWHIKSYEDNHESYNDIMSALYIIMDDESRVKCLATLLNYKEKETFRKLYPYIELKDILKACQILDANRRMRQLNDKIEMTKEKIEDCINDCIVEGTMNAVGYLMEDIVYYMNDMLKMMFLEANYDKRQNFLEKMDEDGRNENRKIDRLRGILKNYENEYNKQEIMTENITELSLTSAKCKMIKGWTRSLSNEKLSMWQSDRRKSQWRKLADLIHFNEKKDFQDETFLKRNYMKFML